MHKRSLDQLFLWTAAVFVVVSIAAVVAIQWFSAAEVDLTYRRVNEQVVAAGVETYAETLTEKTFPQAYWDDAVRNLDNDFSGDWAREYIGVFFWRTGNVELISTLDRDDQITYAMANGRTVEAHRLEGLRQAAAPLIAAVRASEIKRGPLPLLIDLDTEIGRGRHEAPSAQASSVSRMAEARRDAADPANEEELRRLLRPIAATGLARIGNDVYALSATLVQPDNTVLPRTSRSAIVLLGKKIDASALRTIGLRFRLLGLHLDPPDHERTAGWSRALLKDHAGQPVGVLEWRSRHPGRDLVRKTSPALTIFVLLLVVAVALVFRKGRAIASDLTESEARASHMAYHDRLTGLPNRAALENAFEQSLHRQDKGADFAVLCIDVDHFKAVNDNYGHPAGDELLVETAGKIAALCGPDDVLGRFGGDEFMVLQGQTGPRRAAELAEQIVSALAIPVDLGPGRVFVGASVGVVMLDAGQAISAAEAFRRADLAMYRAKELGRGRYHFFERQLDEAVRARQSLQRDLHEALDKRELAVAYQPQVDETGRIIGAEALIRWPRAQAKGITPASFIRLAEETGLIEKLGEFVLERVFTDAARWPDLCLAINVSAVQLRNANFVDRVEQLARKAGADPSRFEFEITEGLLLDREAEITDKLERLRALGFRIALDDFGTGYCGLSYLHLYPIDKVKIDMSFVALLGTEPRGKTLVDAIIRLADALELKVIAEGVETDEQRAILLAMGCAEFQGYLSGAAIPADELDARLKG